eukprot:403346444
MNWFKYIKEGTLIKLCLLIIAILTLITVGLYLGYQFGGRNASIFIYTPSYNVQACYVEVSMSDDEKLLSIQQHGNISLIYIFFWHFIECMGLLICIQVLRNIKDDFNIRLELYLVFGVWFITSYITTAIYLFSDNWRYLTFILIVRNFLVCMITALKPVYQTFQNNSYILLPPSVGSIESLDMVLIIPIASEYFYDYLERQVQDEEAPILFSLYADLRYYDKSCTEDENEQDKYEKALAINQEYLNPGGKFFLNVNKDVKRAIDDKFLNLQQNLNEYLFIELLAYVLERLKEHFERFKRSSEFLQLEEEILRQEKLYEVLVDAKQDPSSQFNGPRHHNYVAQLDLHSPQKTNDNSISANTQANTTQNSTSLSTNMYQQSQVKLQQMASSYARQSIPIKQKGMSPRSKSNSLSKYDVTDRIRSTSNSPLVKRKQSIKIHTPKESNNPIQKINYQSYTKTNKQAKSGNTTKYGAGGPSYSSLNQTKFQQQLFTGRQSNTYKQTLIKKHNYLFPSTTTAKADISTPKKEKLSLQNSGAYQNTYMQHNGIHSTKNSDTKFHKKNSTSYGNGSNSNWGLKGATMNQPAVFSNQKVIKESFAHKNLDLYLKQKYKVNNLLQKDQDSMKNLHQAEANQYQDQSFDKLVSSFVQAKTTKNKKTSERNSAMKRNNTTKYLNLTKAKYGQMGLDSKGKRQSFNNQKPQGVTQKKPKHKYNPKANSSLTKLTIDFRKYNNHQNNDASHDMSADIMNDLSIKNSPQNIIYSSLKKKREFDEYQQHQQYANKLQRQLSYDLLRRSRSRSQTDHNRELKNAKNSASLSNLMIQHMKNVNGVGLNGSLISGRDIRDYNGTQIIQDAQPINAYKDDYSSSDLRLLEVGNECEIDGPASFRAQILRSPKRPNFSNNEGIVPYTKAKSPSVLLNSNKKILGGQNSSQKNTRSRSRSPLKIHNQITKPDTFSSYQSSQNYFNGNRTAPNQHNTIDQQSEHAAKLESFTQYIQQGKIYLKSIKFRRVFIIVFFIVKQVREERSLSKQRRDSTTNTMSRTSFVVGISNAAQGGANTTMNNNNMNRPISQNDFSTHSVKNNPSFNGAASSAKHQNLLRKQLSSNTQNNLPSDQNVQNSEFGAFNITNISEYKLGKVLGQGAYAVVKEGVHRTLGSSLAVKIYDKYKLIDAQRKRSVIREIKILKKMQHENIVTLFDAIDTQRQLYLVMENVEGVSLQQMLKMIPDRKVKEEEAARIFMQIISSMEYVHNQEIAHRDIKLENILIETSTKKVKLIDFGFCCQAKEKLRIFCGTPSYMSPEIVMKREYYGGPSDIWACGVLLYVLLCGTFPFKSSFEKDLFRKISRGQFSFSCQPDLSSEVQDLITQILQVDPHKRPTASQILEHSWFATQGLVCKPVYQIEINSSLGVSRVEDILQSQDSGIKPYHQMRDELKNIKTQSSSSVISGDVLSVGTEGSNAMKTIERVQMKIEKEQKRAKTMLLAQNNQVIDMTSRHKQQINLYPQLFKQQKQNHYPYLHSNTDIVSSSHVHTINTVRNKGNKLVQKITLLE